MKKILIVSVSAGNGHTRAAAALKKAADLFYPQITADHVDFLDFVGTASKKIFFEAYDLIIKNIPTLYRILYDISDNKTGSKILDNITTLNKILNTKKFQSFIVKYSPDAIIFTHFIPAEIFNTFNQTIPSATVITDYENHRLWFTGNKQKYFVAQTGVKDQLIALGAKENNIIISGIPVDPIFYQTTTDANKKLMKKQLKIAENNKVITIMPCGQGKIDPTKLVEKILQEKDITIIALGGKNQDLLQEYEKIKNKNIKIISWTDDIHKYLQLADLVITKPGGMAISECMILNKPMLFINPIPGQEEKNINYITSIGLGTVLEDANLWPEIWNNIRQIKLPPILTTSPANNIIINEIFRDASTP